MNRTPLRRLLPPLATLFLGITGIATLMGVLFWVSCGFAVAGALITWRAILLERGITEEATLPGILIRTALLLSSIMIGFAIFEAALAIFEPDVSPLLFETPDADEPIPADLRSDAVFRSPDGASPLAVTMPADIARKVEAMQAAATMPISWEHRKLQKGEGKQRRFMWQGVYHVYDANKFRREDAFPPLTPGRTRIITLGDSYTYGAAISAFWSYPAQLGRALERDFGVEVLNLGSSGLSSEQIFEKLRTFLPQLDSDFVFYGVCLNDLEPAGYTSVRRWVMPIPLGIEKFIIRHTRLGRFLNYRYDQLLRELGARPDFDSNILVDFDSRAVRFASDVEKMNAIVVEAGLPPVIAMVLNPDTSGSSRNRRMVDAAEEGLREAGMDVIPSAPFSRAFSGRDFRVSRWDGHPNEEANAIWAKMLWQHFVGRPEFKNHRPAQSANAGP